MRDYKLISADSHINEPPDLWETRLPAHLRDRGPRLVRGEDGIDGWVIDGRPPQPVHWGNHAAQKRQEDRPYGEQKRQAINREDWMLGTYDPLERLKEQDKDGVEAEVLYPGQFTGISGAGGFTQHPDDELRHACISVYNDWMAEIQDVAPGRYVGLAIIPIHEPGYAVKEMDRAAARGVKGAVIPGTPDTFGAHPLFSAVYEPIWSKAEELGWPLSFHLSNNRGSSALYESIAANGHNDDLANVSQMELTMTLNCLGIVEPMVMLVYAGILDRHPNLRFVAAEGGIGWIPFVIERMDHVYELHRLWTNSHMTRPPSEYWRDQIYSTFNHRDHGGILGRYITGVDNIMWASDFPHADTTWPYSQKVVADLMGDLPDDEAHKIAALNCAKLYGLV